ncbi:LysM peptidoglycan-binding domain-containing protein [Agrilactobacillus fermenti]|uniref:LysM peptidoglycan-binding domain-containing protein n=1 Tax=Agrilactobacillus fermenti TaxID=2586909 RepID=UPI0022A8D84D
MIYPGQKVETSAAAAPNTQTQTQQTSTRQVTLQQGDSLWTIAQQYGVSVQALAQANGLSSIYALIHPGQTLTIPDNSQAAATQVNTTAPAAEQTSVTQAPVVQQQSAQTTPAAPATQSTQTVAQSGQDQGTFKLSFYDPAVLGSNMGYGGVAANLSVFPKGTRLKITLSDGTVWYRTVNDTGTFAYSNSRQLDVAMPNAQIPSAGIMYANVQVLS